MTAFQEDESQQRLIHRLEAFSDIVIGFSLAQLALSLGIPPHGAADLLKNPDPLVAFILTFAVVCGMWYAHHKLFMHYFVPVRPMIVLNFITLAGVSFAVYSVQLMLHPVHSWVDFAFYEGALAAVYVLLAVQYFYGWSVRRTQLRSALLLRGLRVALWLLGVGAAFLVSALMTIAYHTRVAGLQYAAFTMIAYAIVLRLAFRVWETKRARGANPLTP